MKKKKHVLLYTILGVILAIAAAAAILINGIQRDLDKLVNTPVEDIELSEVADGAYSGSYTVFPVSADVEVVVLSHVIAGARIIRHQNGKGGAGESVVESAVQAGSLTVDTVSGATYSSKVLLLAMRDALVNGNTP